MWNKRVKAMTTHLLTNSSTNNRRPHDLATKCEPVKSCAGTEVCVAYPPLRWNCKAWHDWCIVNVICDLFQTMIKRRDKTELWPRALCAKAKDLHQILHIACIQQPCGAWSPLISVQNSIAMLHNCHISGCTQVNRHPRVWSQVHDAYTFGSHHATTDTYLSCAAIGSWSVKY